MFSGSGRGTRTPDPRIMIPVLYPAELPRHGVRRHGLYTAVANARHIRSRSRACQANPAIPPSACKPRLFRPDAGIAAGAAGRRYHRRVAGIGCRCANFRVNAGWRAQHAIGFRQFVAERLCPLARGRAVRRDGALRRYPLHRRAVVCARGRWRCRLGRWRRRRRRGLCARRPGRGHQHA